MRAARRAAAAPPRVLRARAFASPRGADDRRRRRRRPPPQAAMGRPTGDGLKGYYRGKIEELELAIREKANNLRRLEAQRNELNSHVRLLREELQLLQEPGSYVGEVVKVMGKNKVLVKVHPEGKYVVEVDKSIEVASLATGARVALRNDSYALHLVLPTKVDPLVSLMKVRPFRFGMPAA